MAASVDTQVQEPAGVSARAILLPVLLVFVVAGAVLAILAVAFWVKLGILPTNMSPVTRSSFPAPELQIEPIRDLAANQAKGLSELAKDGIKADPTSPHRSDAIAGMSIDAAMAAVVNRRDPYGPLLDASEVPDTPGYRAMIARQNGSRGVVGPDPGGSNDVATTGPAAGSTSMAPPAVDATPQGVQGLSDDARVPADSLQGTPGYTGAEDGGEVTR